MYTPYPVVVNPFKSALFVVYFRERQKAVAIANEGGVSPNEQFVWVLWKILKGDGNDVSDPTNIPSPPWLMSTSDWAILS